jgi:hypothetical protein
MELILTCLKTHAKPLGSQVPPDPSRFSRALEKTSPHWLDRRDQRRPPADRQTSGCLGQSAVPAWEICSVGLIVAEQQAMLLPV